MIVIFYNKEYYLLLFNLLYIKVKLNCYEKRIFLASKKRK